MNSQNITCPYCDKSFDMEDIVRTEIESEVKNRVDQKLKTRLNELQSEFIKNEKEKIIQHIQSQLDFEYSEKEKVFKRELESKSEKLRKMHSAEVELQRLKLQMKEMKSESNLLTQQRLNQAQDQWNKKFQEERVRADLEKKELEKQIRDQKKQTEEMLRKQTFGSQQLQGEVQELAIEEWLSNKFPQDKIIEVKKGQRGADVIQIVNSGAHSHCGKIYYESKRTQNFNYEWIKKLKDDMSEEGADIGVLVTQKMPKDMPHMGLKDRIWICKFHELKILSEILRPWIIKLFLVKSVQENREGKMEQLYDYITSAGFSESINYQIEIYQSMQDDLNKERRSIQLHWKKRETQINAIVKSMISIAGNLQGIALNKIKPIESLDLPATSEDTK